MIYYKVYIYPDMRLPPVVYKFDMLEKARECVSSQPGMELYEIQLVDEIKKFKVIVDRIFTLSPAEIAIRLSKLP